MFGILVARHVEDTSEELIPLQDGPHTDWFARARDMNASLTGTTFSGDLVYF